MADTKQPNDEYLMPDLENYQEETYEQPQYDTAAPDEAPGSFRENPVLKKAAIVVIAVIIAMVAYKFLGSMFQGDSEKAKSAIPNLNTSKPVPQTSPIPKPSVVETETPVAQSPPPVTTAPVDGLSRKVASLEIAQQSLREDVSNINSQIGTINGNISDLSDKIASMNETLQMLMEKLEQQSNALHRLRVRKVVHKKVQPVKVIIPKVVWHVQAVVPGRAWLIASNGSTLTVRKGSMIPGVGTVSMIDTEQGRVILRSGQIIGFSSQDS